MTILDIPLPTIATIYNQLLNIELSFCAKLLQALMRGAKSLIVCVYICLYTNQRQQKTISSVLALGLAAFT